MTTLEITHSRTAAEIELIVEAMRPGASRITDHTLDHRARLIKPMLSFDNAAVALSFVPAAGEGPDKTVADDAFTYHHLRRDVYELSSRTGVVVDSRYVAPSAHLTVGRFVSAKDFSSPGASPTQRASDPQRMHAWVDTIDEVNRWLQAEHWPDSQAGKTHLDSEWVVGEEKGLDWRHGTLWYGGGSTLRLGQGFER